MTDLTIPTVEEAKAAWGQRKADPKLKQPTLGKRQLAWCRANLKYQGAPIFQQMERIAKTGKLVGAKS